MPATKNVVIKKSVNPIVLQDGQLQSYSDQIDNLQAQLTSLLAQKNAVLAQLEIVSKEMYDYNVKNYT